MRVLDGDLKSMSKFGLFQLLRLRVKYSPTGGSSRGARDFVGNYLPQFSKASPHLDIEVLETKGHPSLEGYYRRNHRREMEVANFDAKEILRRVQFLRDSNFREPQTRIKRHVAKIRTLQGRWNTSLKY